MPGEVPSAVVIVVAVVSVAVSSTLVAYQLGVKWLTQRFLGLCDAFLTLAAVLSIAFTISTCIEVEDLVGLNGQHPGRGEEALYLSMMAYNLALAWAKCAITVQCLRIFIQGKIVSSCWIYLTAMVLYAISILCLNILVCRPAKSVLNSGSCIDRAPLWTATAAVNLGTDLGVTVLAVPLFWEFELQRGQRIVFILIFALGIITSVISGLRLQVVLNLPADVSAKFLTSELKVLAIWSILEVNAAIFCACLPTFGNLHVPHLGHRTCRIGCHIRSSSTHSTIPLTQPSLTALTPPAGVETTDWNTMSRVLSVTPALSTRHCTATAQNIEIDELPRAPVASEVPGGYIFIRTEMEQQNLSRTEDKSQGGVK